MDVSTGWPGSIHDVRVLGLSILYRRGENDVILIEPVKHISYLGLLVLILIIET